MIYTLAKLGHVALFMGFAAFPAWLTFESFGHDDMGHRIVALAMVTLIAFMAKWALIDGFAAVERKRRADQGGPLTAILSSKR